jgi:hypothetical protein
MRIIAIDPGTKQSGVVLATWSGKNEPIWHRVKAEVTPNEEVEDMLLDVVDPVVIEMVACYGMAVGKETFETCVWIGRFMAVAQDSNRIYRRDIKLHLCGSAKAKDANIWQAILDRYGGKESAIGNKKQPGPLYGVKSHARAALAVALTWHDGIRSEGL